MSYTSGSVSRAVFNVFLIGKSSFFMSYTSGSVSRAVFNDFLIGKSSFLLW